MDFVLIAISLLSNKFALFVNNQLKELLELLKNYDINNMLFILINKDITKSLKFKNLLSSKIAFFFFT
jgi:hypothetical protein